MTRLAFVTGLCVMAAMPIAWPRAQSAGGGRGAAPSGQVPAAASGWQYGSVEPLQPDTRGWGWQAKAYVDPATPRPFYNIAKERLFQDQQITSYTISSLNVDLYCEVTRHFDYVWFEMQHSTMSYDDVRRMIQACPRVGAAPMLRLADALESSIQHATDLGALGIIVPTVDDAVEARDAARFSRYPPFGRRSAGGGAYRQIWNVPGLDYRATINDNMLVVVMIETLEGVANADEIAAVHGVDAVIMGNNDLSNFSGWAQTDPRYQDAVTTVHNAALRAGKYFGNAGAQYLTGHRLSASTRIVQNGPARDGWTPGAPAATPSPAVPAPSKPPAPAHDGDEEPVIGMPGTAQPGSRP